MKKFYPVFLILFSIGLTAKSQVVINEIYGGGGNSGSIYKNDFIELYNNSNAAVSLAGWSVQYASATGTSWTATNLTGSIPANGFYLIQESAGTTVGGGTTLLPTPDAIGTIAMAGTAGKVTLVNSTTLLTGSCPTGVTIIDLVGFGTTASCYEGTGRTPAPSNSNSVQRTPAGFDSQNNNTDFTTGLPSPVSSAVADVIAPTITTLLPANAATGIATQLTATITFNETVVKGSAGNILIMKTSDNSMVQTIDILGSAVVVSGNNVYCLVSSLALSTGYYIEITNGAFKDISGNNFAGISGNSTWSFTTAATLPAGTLGTTATFNTCTLSIPDGFTAFTATGTEVWGCTGFGRDPANPSGSAAFENAVQINGYSGGTNVLNEDWLISPSFDLTATNYPLLSYWSRTAFNGAPLQLKVSTNYPGTGNPAAYTWTDLNGRFPLQASNVWTLSKDINLAAYKTTHTYFAFVYHSTPDDGARWTLDDIRIENSLSAPPASLTTSTTDMQFGYVPASTAAVRNFTFTGNDLTGDVTLTATGNYLISKTNGSFSGSITYTQAEANNISKSVFVQFLPAQTSLNYTGTITISTTAVANVLVNLAGNSIDAALTLEVVNWNLEWFGSNSASYGPADKNLQETNIKTITQNIGADLYAFAEVVSEARLQNVVTHLNSVYGAGAYSYSICDYGSHTNPFEVGASPLAEAQKEAFVYKTAVISPIGTPGALIANGVNTAADLNNPAYNYFSSGRYPYMMHANVTLGGVTKDVRFILIHAKANTSPTATSYNRRKLGSDTLNFTLNNLYPNDNIVLLGDFNDDLDQSITSGFTISSYSTFNADAANFFAPTLALSLAGKKSTVSYNDMIDHVEISNEMQANFMVNSASVLTDVSSLVSNYGNTTTDHYPVFTRYAFDPSILPVTLVSFIAVKQNTTALINWSTSQEYNSKKFVVEKSIDSRNWATVGTVNAAGFSNNTRAYSLTDFSPATGTNYYRLKQIDIDGKIQYSRISSLSFDKNAHITISPNPASSFVKIDWVKNIAEMVNIEVIDMAGKVMLRQSTTGTFIQMNTSKLAKGTYSIKVLNGKDISTQKLVIQ